MLRNARKQDRRCCNTVAQCWMMPDKTRMRMPAKSLNRPQRSNVTAAKDNNNIHRFPAAVNRPHNTVRIAQSSVAISRQKQRPHGGRRPSSPPSVRLRAYPTDTAFAPSTQPSQKTKTGLCGLRCAKLFSHILRENRVPADAAAGRGQEKMRGGCGASREG